MEAALVAQSVGRRPRQHHRCSRSLRQIAIRAGTLWVVLRGVACRLRDVRQAEPLKNHGNPAATGGGQRSSAARRMNSDAVLPAWPGRGNCYRGRGAAWGCTRFNGLVCCTSCRPDTYNSYYSQSGEAGRNNGRLSAVAGAPGGLDRHSRCRHLNKRKQSCAYTRMVEESFYGRRLYGRSRVLRRFHVEIKEGECASPIHGPVGAGKIGLASTSPGAGPGPARGTGEFEFFKTPGAGHEAQG